MNNTKWNEIFRAFYYGNECEGLGLHIPWRQRSIKSGYISDWDGTWSHFGCAPRCWDEIDYLQIRLNEQNQAYVIKSLKQIHVPGEIKDDIITIYGYRTDVDYL